jgi:hypothetical protein
LPVFSSLELTRTGQTVHSSIGASYIAATGTCFIRLAIGGLAGVGPAAYGCTTAFFKKSGTLGRDRQCVERLLEHLQCLWLVQICDSTCCAGVGSTVFKLWTYFIHGTDGTSTHKGSGADGVPPLADDPAHEEVQPGGVTLSAQVNDTKNNTGATPPSAVKQSPAPTLQVRDTPDP